MTKTQFFQFEFKQVENDNWKIKIRGYASTPDIDRYNDIVDPKAFENAMKGYMKNPIILLQHNSDKPLWVVINYTLTLKWLEVEVELSNDIENTFNLINNKILKWFSIWYIPKKWEYVIKWDTEIRKISDLDLIEISVVSTPANPNSLFTLAKSIKSFFDENLLNNNEKMEIKEIINEAVDEVIPAVEIKEESDWKEEAVESPAIVETPEVKTNEEAEILKTEIKTLKDMFETQKNELEEYKKLLNWLYDNVLELSQKQIEVKSILDNTPIRKWLASLGWIEKKRVDPLVSALMEAKNNI